MTKITFRWLFSLIVIMAFAFNLNAQTLNQPADWPNADWVFTGTYDASSLLGDPTVSTNFGYDDDGAGSGSTDILNAESPIVDLTTIHGLGETLITVEYEYNYNFGSVFNLEYYDTDASSWVVWEPISTNSGTQSDWCGNITQDATVSIELNIQDFSTTQLNGFKYRLAYDASSVYGWGFCFNAPTIKSGTPPTCPNPSGQTASNFTSTDATLSWIAGGTETDWEVEYGESGFTQGMGNTVAITETFANISLLTPDTDYEFYVRAICGAGDESDWVGAYSFQTTVSCPAPTGLTSSMITLNSATISWNAGAMESLWNYEYGTPGFTPGSATLAVNDTFINLTALTASTAYEFYVQADCGGDQSVWVGPFPFTTACSDLATITSLPWTLDFDSNTECDFTITDSLGTVSQWSIQLISDIPTGNFTNNANTSTSCLLADGSDGAGANTVMISPDIDLTGTGLVRLELSFESQFQDYAGSGDAYCLVSADGMSTWTQIFTESLDENMAGESHVIDLSLYIGSTINIAWQYTAEAVTSWQWAVDNIELINISCEAPSTLGVSNLTDQSADLEWIENGSASVWDIEWDVQGFTPSGTPTINDTPNNSYSFASLTASTAYDFYVRSDCAGDDTEVSNWVGPFTFTTTASCPVPTDLEAAVTATTADLSWNGYAASNWDIEWDVQGFTPTGDPNINDTPNNPYALSTLSPNTAYDFYVRADCGSDNIDATVWVGPYTFTTNCEITTTFPYFESFEGTDMPLCWTILDDDTDGHEFIINPDADLAYDGVQTTSVHWNSSGNDDYLISPQFEITEADLILDFMARSTSDTYFESYNVLISTTGTAPADFTTVLENVVNAPNTWERKMYTLSDQGINVGDQIYVAIQCISSDKFYFAVDAFSIHAPYSSDAEITSYMLPGQDDDAIVAANDSISITMPFGSEFPFTLAAEFALSANATAAVATVPQASTTTDNTWVDNTTPVVYDVTAEDGTIRSWSVYIAIASGVNNVIDSKDVTVYPNPNTGEFNIAFNLNNVKTVNIEILNVQGQVIRSFDNMDSDKTQTIDLSEQSEGMYFVRISSENETIVKKVNIIK